MSIKLDIQATREIVQKCQKCSLFKVEKIRGMNPMNTLQIGHCSIYGEIHSLDYSGFTIEFDSRKCDDFKKR